MTESPKPSPRPPSKSRHNARDAPPSSPSSKKLNGPPPPSSAHSIDLPSQTTPITPSPLPQPKPISTLPTLVQQEKESRHQLATQRLEWAKELLRYVQRTQPTILAPSPPPSSSSSSVNASKKNPLLGPDLTYDITDPSLLKLVDTAITFILSLAHPAQLATSSSSQSASLPPDKLYAEALYLSADLSSTGLFPKYKPKDLRTSFRAFETSAKVGFLPAWFRLGRDYEGVGDVTRAVDCFTKGASGMEKSCLYVRLPFSLCRSAVRGQKSSAVSLWLLLISCFFTFLMAYSGSGSPISSSSSTSHATSPKPYPSSVKPLTSLPTTFPPPHTSSACSSPARSTCL